MYMYAHTYTKLKTNCSYFLVFLFYSIKLLETIPVIIKLIL